MSTLKIAAAAITLALIVPGVALAKGTGPDGAKGKAGAPGQVCKSLKVRGEKTPEQRAAYKACIKDAAAERKAAAKRQAVAKRDAARADRDDDAGDIPGDGDEDAVDGPDAGDAD